MGEGGVFLSQSVSCDDRNFSNVTHKHAHNQTRKLTHPLSHSHSIKQGELANKPYLLSFLITKDTMVPLGLIPSVGLAD